METFRSRSSSAAAPLAVIIFFFGVGVSLVLSDVKTTEDWIEDICMHTYVPEEYVLCKDTFNEHLKIPDTGLVGLAQIAIDQSLHNATNTRKLIHNMLKDSGRQAPLRDVLATCDRSYKTIVESFQRASSYFSQKDYQKAMDAASPGTVAQNKCYRNLTGAPRRSPSDPLVESNSQMKILVSMSLVTLEYLVST